MKQIDLDIKQETVSSKVVKGVLRSSAVLGAVAFVSVAFSKGANADEVSTGSGDVAVETVNSSSSLDAVVNAPSNTGGDVSSVVSDGNVSSSDVSPSAVSNEVKSGVATTNPLESSDVVTGVSNVDSSSSQDNGGVTTDSSNSSKVGDTSPATELAKPVDSSNPNAGVAENALVSSKDDKVSLEQAQPTVDSSSSKPDNLDMSAVSEAEKADTTVKVDSGVKKDVSGTLEVPFTASSKVDSVIAPRQVIMMLDTSGSMVEKMGDKTSASVTKEQAKAVINSLKDGDKAMLIFSSLNNNISGIATDLTGDKSELLSALDKYDDVNLTVDPDRHGMPWSWKINKADGVDTPSEDLIAKQAGFDKNNAYVVWFTDDWSADEVDKVDSSFFDWMKANTRKQLAVVNTYSQDHAEKSLSNKAFTEVGAKVMLIPSSDDIIKEFDHLTSTEKLDELTVKISSDYGFDYSNVSILDKDGAKVASIENGKGSIEKLLSNVKGGDYKLKFDYSGGYQEGDRTIKAELHSKLDDKSYSNKADVHQDKDMVDKAVGTVLVRYQSGGIDIASPKIISKGVDAGSSYDVKDVAVSTITVGGSVYKLKDGSTSGDVKQGVNTVLLNYELAQAPLTVKILANGDKELVPAKVVNGNVGSAYDISALVKDNIVVDGLSYSLANKSDIAEKGVLSESGNTITLNYQEDKGHVIVNLVDKDGKLLANTVSESIPVKSSYNFDKSEIAPAKLVMKDKRVYARVSGDMLKGSITSLNQVIAVPYNEVLSSLSVAFVDESGKELQPSVKVADNQSVGSKVSVSDKYISRIVTSEGKVYEKSPSKEFSTDYEISEKAQIVNLVYKEVKSDLRVNFVSTNGDRLLAPLVKGGLSINSDFDVTSEIKDELTDSKGLYELKTDKSVLKGKIKEGANDITLEYAPVMSTATIRFVDENGNVIQGDIQVSDIQVSSLYDFSSYGEQTLTINGQEYSLVGSSNVKGMKERGNLVVTFTYKAVPKPVGVAPSAPTPEPVTPAPVSVPVLPQTGEGDSSGLVIAGLSAIGLASAVGLMTKRRVESEED